MSRDKGHSVPAEDALARFRSGDVDADWVRQTMKAGIQANSAADLQALADAAGSLLRDSACQLGAQDRRALQKLAQRATFAARLTALLARSSTTRTQLAEDAEIDPSFLSHLLRCRYATPTRDTCHRLALALGVEVSELTHGLPGPMSDRVPKGRRRLSKRSRELVAFFEDLDERGKRLLFGMARLVHELSTERRSSVARAPGNDVSAGDHVGERHGRQPRGDGCHESEDLTAPACRGTSILANGDRSPSQD